MVFRGARKLLDLWSNSAILTRLDKRKLQQESDLHRIYLLTEHRYRNKELDSEAEAEDYARSLSAEAAALGADGTAAAVQRRLLGQALSSARALHAALVDAGDGAAIEAEEEARRRMRGAGAKRSSSGGGGGLASAVGANDADDGDDKGGHCPSSSPPPVPPPPLSLIADALSSSLGFSLTVRRSSIPGAGDGVFVAEKRRGGGKEKNDGSDGENDGDYGDDESDGSIAPGTLAVLYPGVAYPPLSYRSMAGYPRVDAGSDYLAARYDGIVLDAVAWGSSPLTSSSSSPTSSFAPPRPRPEGVPLPTGDAAAAERVLAGGTASSSSSSSSSPSPRPPLPLIEARNPLALAHLVNHPPAGAGPNVAVASFDVALPRSDSPPSSSSSPSVSACDLEKEPWLRRYFPVVVVGQEGASAAAAAGEGQKKDSSSSSSSLFSFGAAPPPPRLESLPCLGLVALRRIAPGQELLLNYRLSSKLKKPEWYVPVDSEEESRRWA